MNAVSSLLTNTFIRRTFPHSEIHSWSLPLVGHFEWRACVVPVPVACILERVSEILYIIIRILLGPVVRTLISAKPWLNFNSDFFFFCPKAFSRIIFSILSKALQSFFKLAYFLSLHIWIQISHSPWVILNWLWTTRSLSVLHIFLTVLTTRICWKSRQFICKSFPLDIIKTFVLVGIC